MKLNIVVFSILVLCYIATIVFTIFKIKDIHRNPEKYEHQDLIDETNRSMQENGIVFVASLNLCHINMER